MLEHAVFRHLLDHDPVVFRLRVEIEREVGPELVDQRRRKAIFLGEDFLDQRRVALELGRRAHESLLDRGDLLGVPADPFFRREQDGHAVLFLDVGEIALFQQHRLRLAGERRRREGLDDADRVHRTELHHSRHLREGIVENVDVLSGEPHARQPVVRRQFAQAAGNADAEILALEILQALDAGFFRRENVAPQPVGRALPFETDEGLERLSLVARDHDRRRRRIADIGRARCDRRADGRSAGNGDEFDIDAGFLEVTLLHTIEERHQVERLEIGEAHFRRVLRLRRERRRQHCRKAGKARQAAGQFKSHDRTPPTISGFVIFLMMFSRRRSSSIE